MKDYKKWLQEALFQHHVLTRAENIEGDTAWCICPIEKDVVGRPLVFGKTIEAAIENFKKFVEFREED